MVFQGSSKVRDVLNRTGMKERLLSSDADFEEYKRKIDYFDKAYDGLHADVSSFLKTLNENKPRISKCKCGECDGKCKCDCNGECECGGKCECKNHTEHQYDASASVKQLIDELFDGDISDFCNKLFL